MRPDYRLETVALQQTLWPLFELLMLADTSNTRCGVRVSGPNRVANNTLSLSSPVGFAYVQEMMPEPLVSNHIAILTGMLLELFRVVYA